MPTRTYTISNAPPPPPFSATVTTAPPDGASLSGTVAFAITGFQIRNAELLPGSGYSPVYGNFTTFNNDQDANFSWNTTQVANGPITVRISAFDQPSGVTPANEIIAMAARNYIINNAAPAPPPPTPPPAPPPPPGPSIPGPDREFCFLNYCVRVPWIKR
jgi:hypothetical protein